MTENPPGWFGLKGKSQMLASAGGANGSEFGMVGRTSGGSPGSGGHTGRIGSGPGGKSGSAGAAPAAGRTSGSTPGITDGSGSAELSGASVVGFACGAGVSAAGGVAVAGGVGSDSLAAGPGVATTCDPCSLAATGRQLKPWHNPIAPRTPISADGGVKSIVMTWKSSGRTVPPDAVATWSGHHGHLPSTFLHVDDVIRPDVKRDAFRAMKRLIQVQHIIPAPAALGSDHDHPPGIGDR